MSLKIIFLGCRAPSLSFNGFTSIAVVLDSEIVLLDAGEGTQKYLNAIGLSLAKISKIFISHLHGDHVLGLIPLMESRSLLDIQKPLEIYGPPGIKEFVNENLKLLNFTPSYDYQVVEGLNIEVNSTKYRVRSFPTCHSITTLGFRIEVRKRIITYTSDTMPCQEVYENSLNSNVLIHDSTFSHCDADKARSFMHSTSTDAALTAIRAGANLLVLTHISQRYSNPNKLLYEAKSKFFNTILAEELMTVML